MSDPASVPGSPPTSEGELEEFLTRPSPALVEAIRLYASPLILLGAGGKMGPTLARLAQRAAAAAGHPLEILAVSRFGDAAARNWFESQGIRTLAGDLLDPAFVAGLPDTTNVVYLVGLKFGTAQNPAATWAINTLVPPLVCARYPRARVVALSTGNVYPLTPVAQGGARENHPLTPLGEYGNAAVGRERLFEFAARRYGTSVTLLRLFYAVELRYGVLVDLARKVWAGEPIDLRNGYFNCIWQGDANEWILRALPLAQATPSAWNLCHPEVFRVRDVAEQLGGLLGRAPVFREREMDTALLGNSAALAERLATPLVAVEAMLPWIASWIQAGGRNLGRPTHFEVRDGVY